MSNEKQTFRNPEELLLKNNYIIESKTLKKNQLWLNTVNIWKSIWYIDLTRWTSSVVWLLLFLKATVCAFLFLHRWYRKNRSYQAHSLISFIFLCVYFQCILAQYMCEFLTWSYLDAFRWWLINSRFKRFFSCKAAWSFAFWEGRESNKERVGCLVPLSSCLQGNLHLSASHTAKLHLKIII